MTKLFNFAICKNIFFIALLLTLQSCSVFARYSAEPITGWVVDEDTGQPLEGVFITANWQVSEGNLAGTNSGGQIQIMETVTDKAGRYHFPAWGPKSLPPKKNGWWVDQYIGSEDPWLAFFKSGYEIDTRYNAILISERNTSWTRRSDWDGKTIKLKFLGVNTKEYRENLEGATSVIGFAYSGNNCEWQKIPHMLAALFKETEKFSTPRHYNYGVNIKSIPGDPKCGSVDKFFEEYLK